MVDATAIPSEKVGLRLEGVSLSFGGVAALKDVSLVIRPGETVGLIGPNGAGKSTLVNCIVGLYRPNSGNIWLGESLINDVAPHRRAALGISRTFQNLRLLRSLSVLDNVMLGCHPKTKAGMLSGVLHLPRHTSEEEAIRERCLSLLDQFDMRRIADRPVVSLAYPEQKATEICRALAADPDLLLLDEPAAGMSGAERENTVDIITALSKRRLSILLIEHDVALVMRTCQRVAVLDYGIKIADGSPEEVRNHRAVVTAYFGED